MERAEKLGLGLALTGHVLLFGALSLGIASRSELRVPSTPITVQLTDEVGLESTAPTPAKDAATNVAPELGEAMELPDPVVTPRPDKQPDPVIDKPKQQKPVEAKKPAQVKVTQTRPSADKPKPKTEKPPAKKPENSIKTAATSTTKPKGGSRLGDDYLKGVTDKPSTSKSQTAPAAAIGPQIKSSLQREVYRQLKPHWQAPTGADADQLRTELSIRLAEDGSIIGTPRVLRTTGQTPSNQAQVKLHQERAIRAAQLASPFNLPPQYYEAWKLLEPIGFYTGL